MDYPCEKCGQREAVKKEKYCKDCKKAVLAEMKEAGYLTPKAWGHAGQNRPAEAKEKTYETKHGTWQR